MLSVAIDLLTGRYTATAFNDWSAPEWPPHPARLLSALVATWADDDAPDSDERAVLRWLEALAAPVLACSVEPALAHRAPITVFVPVNDPTALTRDVHRSTYKGVLEAKEAVAGAEGKAVARAEKKLAAARLKSVTEARKAATSSGMESPTVIAGVLELLPDERSKQGRWFPTVVPDDSEVWLSWPDAEPTDAQLGVLDRLCARVARLGHSSTFVSCRATLDAPPAPTLLPDAGDGMTLRVPRAGMVDRLEHMFAAQEGRAQGPLPSGSAVYATPDASSADVPAPLLGGDWIVLSMPRRLGPDGPEALPVTRALDLARAVRGALLRHATEPVPEILSGHQGGARPTVASARPHVAVVPLPNVSSRHSDGAVLGVALVLPTTVTADERHAVEDAVRAWTDANGLSVSMGGPGGRSLRFPLDKARFDPAPGVDRQGLQVAPQARTTLRRSTWCRPATEWVSATPIALDRFPGDLASPRPDVRAAAEDAARLSVARACGYAGLPEPIEVEVDTVSFLGSAPPANRAGRSRGFPAFVAGTSRQARLGVHARLRFAEPVAGPVLVGAGRYLGYGLCVPLGRGLRP